MMVFFGLLVSMGVGVLVGFGIGVEHCRVQEFIRKLPKSPEDK